MTLSTKMPREITLMFQVSNCKRLPFGNWMCLTHLQAAEFSPLQQLLRLLTITLYHEH